MKIKKVKIYILGCKVNQYDGMLLTRQLAALGFEKVDTGADLAIINTCTVTRTAIRKNRNIINKAKLENPGARIIITGCWPKVYNQEVKATITKAVLLAKKEILPFIRKEFRSRDVRLKQKIVFNKSKSRYFLKIQDGCEQFCSYCIIPYARGRLASRGAGEVIDEIKAAVKAGYQEIVLCGIHLGLYGVDLPIKANLTALLEKIIKIRNLGRIRLSSIEVTEVGDGLIKLIARSRKICRHLHIPLQSGSDKILKLMNRPYNKKYFTDKITKIRQAVPDIAITTDVIVGFPGETEKDFIQTCVFVNKMNFSRSHIFPFSAHEKTPAAKLPGKVKIELIKNRAGEMRKIGQKLAEDYRNKFVGKSLDIVVEKQVNDKISGKTQYYFDIEINKNKSKISVGQIIKTKFCHA